MRFPGMTSMILDETATGDRTMRDPPSIMSGEARDHFSWMKLPPLKKATTSCF